MSTIEKLRLDELPLCDPDIAPGQSWSALFIPPESLATITKRGGSRGRRRQSEDHVIAPAKFAKIIVAHEGGFDLQLFSGSDGVGTGNIPAEFIGQWFQTQGFDTSVVEWEADLPRESREIVYFIRTVGASFVKIGWSASPGIRLSYIQVGCPFPLQIAHTEPGGQVHETALHRQFATHRVRADGEWFHWCDEIESYVTSAKSRSDR